MTKGNPQAKLSQSAKQSQKCSYKVGGPKVSSYECYWPYVTKKSAMGKMVTSPIQLTCTLCNCSLTAQLKHRLAHHNLNSQSTLYKALVPLSWSLSPLCVDDRPLHAGYFCMINTLVVAYFLSLGSFFSNARTLTMLLWSLTSIISEGRSWLGKGLSPQKCSILSLMENSF